MGLANRITLFRIALAPVFAGLFSAWAAWRDPTWLALVWAVFLVSEFSDILDGWVARKLGQTSDLGKLLDPFSDVLSRLTIFTVLLLVGVAPLWFFLIVLYREVSMTFLRLLIVQQGVVQGASSGGKLKAWLYFFASLAGIVHVTWPDLVSPAVSFWVLNGLFALAAFLSVFSFTQYLIGYAKLRRSRK
jgi:CDP-diacylglycerol--glycerol-3-phosphate 3-phosphatidyltransferase